jgi:hypothetical protein
LHAEGGPSAGRAALWLLGLAALLLSLGANRASQMAVAMAPAAVVAFLVAWASLTASMTMRLAIDTSMGPRIEPSMLLLSSLILYNVTGSLRMD